MSWLRVCLDIDAERENQKKEGEAKIFKKAGGKKETASFSKLVTSVEAAYYFGLEPLVQKTGTSQSSWRKMKNTVIAFG